MLPAPVGAAHIRRAKQAPQKQQTIKQKGHYAAANAAGVGLLSA